MIKFGFKLGFIQQPFISLIRSSTESRAQDGARAESELMYEGSMNRLIEHTTFKYLKK